MYISLIYLLGNADPTLIAIATAWFAIFITIGVVASSYAIRLREERTRVRKILDNSQDGIFCFDLKDLRIREINTKCAQWLKYNQQDLVGKEISVIWTDREEQKQFVADVNQELSHVRKHGERDTLSCAGWFSFKVCHLPDACNKGACALFCHRYYPEVKLWTRRSSERSMNWNTRSESVPQTLNGRTKNCVQRSMRFESTVLYGHPLQPKREDP